MNHVASPNAVSAEAPNRVWYTCELAIYNGPRWRMQCRPWVQSEKRKFTGRQTIQVSLRNTL